MRFAMPRPTKRSPFGRTTVEAAKPRGLLPLKVLPFWRFIFFLGLWLGSCLVFLVFSWVKQGVCIFLA